MQGWFMDDFIYRYLAVTYITKMGIYGGGHEA